MPLTGSGVKGGLQHRFFGIHICYSLERDKNPANAARSGVPKQDIVLDLIGGFGRLLPSEPRLYDDDVF